MKIKKRGVSPVIAVVLLLLLAFVLGALILAWASGFISDKTSGSEFSASQLCSAVDFDVVSVDQNSWTYSFDVVNRGDIDIASFKFRVYYSDGGESMLVDPEDSPVSVSAGGSASGHIYLNLNGVDEVEIFAVLDKELVGGSSNVTCKNNPVYFYGD